MWNQGIHARSGVACADCHMPYKREGALKISDHHVRSPLMNINRACQTCHKWSEDELKARVETIQGRTHNLRNLAMDALVDLINDIKAARAMGRTDTAVSTAQDFQRRAQFYLDFIESENSNGFHAPQEATRILGESINFSRKGHGSSRRVAINLVPNCGQVSPRLCTAHLINAVREITHEWGSFQIRSTYKNMALRKKCFRFVSALPLEVSVVLPRRQPTDCT